MNGTDTDQIKKSDLRKSIRGWVAIGLSIVSILLYPVGRLWQTNYKLELQAWVNERFQAKTDHAAEQAQLNSALSDIKAQINSLSADTKTLLDRTARTDEKIQNLQQQHQK